MSDALTLTSADGLSLEAALDDPGDPKAVVVFCHPHPKMGGTMNAPLIVAVTEELVSRRWAVLRFNFRGIGSSEGEASIGIDEVADAVGALREVRERFAGLPVALVGWSFGAAVVIRVLDSDHDVSGAVLIAPAIGARDEVTAGAPDPSELDITTPLLVIRGSNDDLVGGDECRKWVEGVPSAGYQEMKGANHFFWGKYEALAAATAGFLDETLTD